MNGTSAAGYVRDEPDANRYDRNYGELLQELRVVLTGVQILFAFLLAIAFQQRFASAGTGELALYLIALCSSACASVVLTAPAAVHRVLFRQKVKGEIVDVTAQMIKIGMACLAVAMVTSVCFVVLFVAGPVLGWVTSAALGVLVAVTWLQIPRRHRSRRPATTTHVRLMKDTPPARRSAARRRP